MHNLKKRLLPIFFVTIAISLNITCVIILKQLADYKKIDIIILALGLCIIFILNIVRLIIWGIIHKRFELTTSFPLTSIFYPLILLISYLLGEVIALKEIVATCFIVSGVLWLALKSEPDN